MKKHYVVCVTLPSDWPEIHNLLLQDGTLDDNIPSRSCECADRTEVYPNRGTYLLDEDEVDLVKNHPKVSYVELDSNFHPEILPPVSVDDNKFDGPVRVYRGDGLRVRWDCPPTNDISSGTGEKTYNATLVHEDKDGNSETGLKLNIRYFGKGGATRPVVLAIHGGLFFLGDKDDFDANDSEGNKANFFTDLGYVYVSVDYRLVRNDNLLNAFTGSGFYTPTVNQSLLDFTSTDWTNRFKGEQAAVDIVSAIKFLSEKSLEFGIDPNKIILLGHSAGSFYSTLLGTRKELFEEKGLNISCIKGVISMDVNNYNLSESLSAVPADTTGGNDWGFMNAWGVTPTISTVDFPTFEQAQAHWSKYSPVSLAEDPSRPASNYAPNFLIVGRGQASRKLEDDQLVDALKNKGLNVKQLFYPGSISGPGTISGTVLYNHEGIHKVIGNTTKGDLVNTDQDIIDSGHKNITTEIRNWLKTTDTEPLKSELNRTSWNITRFSGKTDDWNSFVKLSSSEADTAKNREYAALTKTLNVSYPTSQDGSNVDIVVADNGAWHGHPEFVDGDGVSQIKDIILDGPYYIDPDYFNDNSKTTTFLGRVTCTELAARAWWEDSTQRSSQFSSAPTVSGLPANYTRANICGSYSAYPALASVSDPTPGINNLGFADHGTPVASLIYGKTFGASFNANKWNIAFLLGPFSAGYLPSHSKTLEVLTVFHNHKPVNSALGAKPLTVVNNSWGYISRVADAIDGDNNLILWAPGTYYYNFRGTIGSFTITSTGNSSPAPEFLKNFSSDLGSKYSQYLTGSLKTAGDTFVNLPGVVWVCSAGNSNQNQVNPGEADYDNYWSTVDPNGGDFVLSSHANYVNRRGSPADYAYDSTKNSYKTISVGALNNYLDSNAKQTKAWYSNSGTAIDCFAPSNGTLGAAGNSFQETYPRYDSQFYYSWLNKAAFDISFSGTSAASPSTAGWISSVLSRLSYWGQTQAKKYINFAVESQTNSSIEQGSNPASANATEFDVYENLFAGDLKVIYNKVVSGLTLGLDLPPQTTIPNSRDVTLKVIPISGLVDTYSYQWQVANSPTQAFQDISGATSNTLELVDVPNENIGLAYRCKIISDGPYLLTYSGTTQLVLDLDDIVITSQPSNKKILKGSSGSIVIQAVGDESVTLGFQWQKLNQTTNEWEELAGKTKNTLAFNNAQDVSAGFYRCVVSDPLKFVISDVAQITVFESILSFTKADGNTTKFKGDDLTLEVNAFSTGNASIAYFWQSSNNETSGFTTIPGATSRFLSFKNLKLSDGKYYRCVAQDSISSNSPITTAPLLLTVQPITMNVGSAAPINVTALEGEELTLFINATINNGVRPSFRFEKRETLNGNNFWKLFQTNNEGEIFFAQVPKSFAGLYKCIVSDPTGNNNDVVIEPINVTVNSSFEVGSVTSSPTLALIDQEITLTPDVRVKNPALSYSFLWQRRETSTDEWKNIYSTDKKDFTFTFTGSDFGDEFRCEVSNNLGTKQYSSAFTISASPFVDISKDLQEKISFKENTLVEHDLDPEVVSTHPNTLSYQWQKSLDKTNTWSDITGQTNKKLELTPDNIALFNSGNTDDFYHLRLKITFAQTSPDTVIYSKSTLVDLLDAISLFGDGLGACLTQDQADELYNTDLTDARVAHGNTSLPDRQYLETINVDPIGAKDKCKDKNTCGISIDELFDKYPIYNTQKGLYKSWGDIEFPWQLEEARNPSGVTCNLNDVETDDKWQIAKYKALYAYFPKIGSGGLSSPPDATCLTERPADRVIRIEDDGYRVSLYEAIDLVPALSGPFDRTKWKKICHIITSIPAGLPTPEEIKERYDPFELDFFLEDWAEYAANWSENFYQQNFDDCRSNNSLLADVEKCMKKKDGPFGESSDEWKNARIRKEFFYRVGDYAWVEGECKDTVCLYICVQDIPATELFFNKLKQFKPRIKPSSEITNYTVAVKGVTEGNRYFIDGSQQPTLNLIEGQTYRFRQDDSSNANHQIRLSATPNGTHGGGVEFTQGVTKVGTAGSLGAYTEIKVPPNAPPLYYYCVNHSLMGGTANTLGPVFWERVYCVNTGMNKCLEPQRNRDLPNYQLVELGSKGHYVEQPLPYYDLKGNTLCNDFELLNEFVEQEAPRVLTQEEIDALDQPT